MVVIVVVVTIIGPVAGLLADPEHDVIVPATAEQ